VIFVESEPWLGGVSEAYSCTSSEADNARATLSAKSTSLLDT